MGKATAVAALLGVVLAGGSAWATEWAEKMFAESEHDFGTVARAATAEHEFKLTNLYAEDVRITGVRSSCGCTSVWVKDNKRVLKTHETGAIVAHVNSDKFLGSKGATITVTLDRPYPAQAQLRVRTYIRDDVALRPGSVQLGSVKQGTAAERSIEVLCPGQGGLRPVDVRSADPHLSARLLPAQGGWGQSTYRLVVRLDEQAPAGVVQRQLMLVLSDRRTQIPVPVAGRVVAGVTVSPERLLIGSVDPGGEVRRMVIVRGTTPFRITEVRSESDAFRLAAPDEDSTKPVHVIPVTFTAGDRPGQVVGTIYIETDQGGEPVKVTARAEVNDAPPVLVRVEAGEPDTAAPPAETAAASVEPPSAPAILAVGHEEAPADPPIFANGIPSLFAQPADAPTEDAPSTARTEADPVAAGADQARPTETARPFEESQSPGKLNEDLLPPSRGLEIGYQPLSKRVREYKPPVAGQNPSELPRRWGLFPSGRRIGGQYFPLSANSP
ncbi:MAG TPA: DUF1573 domain-containing protein [Thermoguttaceae bacterium]|nr:DUF1573 domain-containing protein [Thermoguttaceae bacterium]